MVLPVLALTACGADEEGPSTSAAAPTTSAVAATTSAAAATTSPAAPTTDPSPGTSPTPSGGPLPEPASAFPSTAAAPSSAAGTTPPAGATGFSPKPPVPVPGVRFTRPDTLLSLGEKAVVPFALSDSVGAVGVTVTEVDRGSAADLAPFRLGDAVKGLTPYYVRITVTNETGGAFAYSSLGLTAPLLADASPAQRLSVLSDFAPCPNEFADAGFTRRGARYRTCVVGLAGPGTEVVGLAYRGSTSGRVEDEPEYFQDPIRWRGPRRGPGGNPDSDTITAVPAGASGATGGARR